MILTDHLPNVWLELNDLIDINAMYSIQCKPRYICICINSLSLKTNFHANIHFKIVLLKAANKIGRLETCCIQFVCKLCRLHLLFLAREKLVWRGKRKRCFNPDPCICAGDCFLALFTVCWTFEWCIEFFNLLISCSGNGLIVWTNSFEFLL